MLDENDGFELIPLDGRTDTDGDGYPDDCDAECLETGMLADADDDGDGVADSSDDFPLDKDETVDTDGDGIGNNEDTDDDGDGVSDEEEKENETDPLNIDTDGDLSPDGVDAFPLDPSAFEAGGAGATGFKLPSTITVLKTEG